MLHLEMLPASDGDCLLLSYDDSRSQRHVLIDGGRVSTYEYLRTRLAEIGQRGEWIELLVLTHYDADHIGGFLRLTQDRELPVAIKEVWYNGYDQLSAAASMGHRQADALSKALRRLSWKANIRFDGMPIQVPDAGGPLSTELEGGLILTILSPDTTRLAALRDSWDAWRAAGTPATEEEELLRSPDVIAMSRQRTSLSDINVETLAACKELQDNEVANGSSIAFLAEFQGRSVLMTGDAHPSLLAKTIRQLPQLESGSLPLNLCKISHHGSARNTTRELLSTINCRRFAISTDGSRHGHPDPESMARILIHGPEQTELFFNYRQKNTTCWESRALQQRFSYSAIYGNDVGHLRITV